MIYFLEHKTSRWPSDLKKNLFDVKFVDALSDIENIYLLMDDNKLSISDKNEPNIRPVNVDFLTNRFIKRLDGHKINSELLNKALGKKQKYRTILDATAGMGVDSMILAGLGLNVLAYEVSAPIYLMLKDGLSRAQKDGRLTDIASRVSLKFGNSLTCKDAVDVIYVDFMFSKDDKKSKSKKDMEIFKKITILPEEDQVIENLNKYMNLNFKRLILKRPLKAELFRIGKYSHSVEGKAIRYDIYLPS